MEACRSRGVHLAAGVVISSHPDYQKAYQLVADGRIGQVQRINLYEKNGQGGCHGLNLVRKFAGRAPVEWVSGWVEGDPHSDYEEPYKAGENGFGGLGGYLRFANGIECYSSCRDVAWKGLEVVGSEGVLANWNNTALGLRLWKVALGEQPRRAEALVEEEGLFEVHRAEDRGYDKEGWLDVGDTMRAIVAAIVAALETGAELQVTTGNDLRHALEMAIALRQSHRCGHRAIALPLEDRSLVMYPEKGRWHYKKEVYGQEWYMEQMAAQKNNE